MRLQSDYVNRIAKGNATIILSSGFNVSKQPGARKILDFAIKAGKHSGEVSLKHVAPRGRYACVWQYCEDALLKENKWSHADVTLKSQTTIKGLKPISKYWFRVAFVTIEGQSEWCKAIDFVVA